MNRDGLSLVIFTYPVILHVVKLTNRMASIGFRRYMRCPSDFFIYVAVALTSAIWRIFLILLVKETNNPKADLEKKKKKKTQKLILVWRQPTVLRPTGLAGRCSGVRRRYQFFCINLWISSKHDSNQSFVPAFLGILPDPKCTNHADLTLV